jgi:beta-phosphoglucomutase-like phosphatase (HAD superfamily)
MQTYKPTPLIFQAILSKLGVEPHNAVMIGNDIEKDIFGALNQGLRVIWFNKSNIRWEDHFPNIEMPISVQKLKDVLSLIQESLFSIETESVINSNRLESGTLIGNNNICSVGLPILVR